MHPILIADDSHADAVLLERLLRRSHVMNPIRMVTDGEAVIAYLNGKGAYGNRDRYPLPSILFLDLKMPRCSGFEVLEYLYTHTEFQAVLTIVLSKLDDLQEINRAYQLGARSYLIKPATAEELTNLIGFFQGYWDTPETVVGHSEAVPAA